MSGPEPSPRTTERLGDRGEQVAQRLADRLGGLGRCADGFAKEPDAIADVARLVVVDVRVAVDEARQQPLALEVVGGEAECGQAERALKDQVVDRHEADLGREVPGAATSSSWASTSASSKMLAKGRRDLRRARSTWAVTGSGEAITSSWKRA